MEIIRICREMYRGELGISRLESATYEREIERYGGLAGMQLAEKFFGYDSDMVLEAIGSDSHLDSPVPRWLQSLVSIHRMLQLAPFDHAERMSIIADLRDALRSKYPLSSRGKQNLGKKFRQQRVLLERTLAYQREGTKKDKRGAEERMSDALVSALHDYQELVRKGELSTTIPRIMGSFIHMHINRMVNAETNLHECVIYEFLFQMYKTAMIRQSVETF
jgi:thiopeptide-type bacteriocin biosynthesis protein